MEGSVSTDRRPAAHAPAGPHRPPAEAPSATIRLAGVEDVPAVAAAVRELLSELSGQAPPPAALERVARAVIEDPGAGAVLVAAEGERITGVLTVSWQIAIHVPGRYALIQDLWVAPERRSAAIGRALLLALFDLALEREIVRVEVGLPSERFTGLAATARFYEANGFSQLGPRMRQMLL
jgi:para-aminobenzoate synthetase